jgi:uncharacterized protein (DUF2164 family)
MVRIFFEKSLESQLTDTFESFSVWPREHLTMARILLVIKFAASATVAFIPSSLPRYYYPNDLSKDLPVIF